MRDSLNLPKLPDGFHLQRTGISINDELIGAFSVDQQAHEFEGKIPSLPTDFIQGARVDSSTYVIGKLVKGSWQFMCQVQAEFHAPEFDILNERVVLAPPRSWHSPSKAMIVENGNILATFDVGDAIETIQFSEDGSIWVAYFDEGIYSDDKLSQECISIYNSGGILQKNAFSDGGWQQDDTTVLNIGREAFWLSFVAQPFVRMNLDLTGKVYEGPNILGKVAMICTKTGKISYRNSLSNIYSKVLAFTNTHILIHDRDEHRFILFEIKEDSLKTIRSISDRNVFGRNCSEVERIRSRNDRVHLVTKDKWMWSSIDEFL